MLLNKRKVTIIIMLIFLTGAALRFYSLGQKSFWYDESNNLLGVSSQSFNEILFSGYFHATPPVYYLLLKFWVMFFGIGYFAVRSLSAIFGILSLYFIYRVGSILYGKRAGILSALFLSISPLHLFYSQDATAYVFFVLTCLIVVFVILKLNITRRKNLWSFYLIIVLLGLLLTHYYAVFFLLSINLFFLINYKRSSDLFKRLFVVQVIILFFFIPYFNYILSKLIRQGFVSLSWISTVPIKETFFDVLGAFSYGGAHYGGADINISSRQLIIPGFLNYIYLFCILFGFRVFFNDKEPGAAKGSGKEFFLLLWLLGGIICALVFSLLFFPIFVPRYIIYSLPAWYILIAKGLNDLRLKSLRNSLIIIIIILNIFSLSYYYHNELKSPWKKISQYLYERGFNDDDLIVFMPAVERRVLLFNAYFLEKDRFYKKSVTWCQFKEVLFNSLCRRIENPRRVILIHKKQRVFLIQSRWSGTKYKSLINKSRLDKIKLMHFDDCIDSPDELRNIFNNLLMKIKENYFDSNGNMYSVSEGFQMSIIQELQGIYVGEFLLNS